MTFPLRTMVSSVALSALLTTSLAIAEQGPSFNCSEKMTGSITALICQNPDLAALDRKLATIYRDALKNAGKRGNVLKAEQRGWIKGRDECWKTDDQQACVADSYRRRIVELQTGYGLVTSSAPVMFDCASNGRISVTFFQTEPPSLTALYKGRQSLMLEASSASGSRYLGQNESFWEHQGEAAVTWGHGVEEMICKKAG